MQRLSISKLIPGMITAEDIFNYNDQLILSKGTVLTDKSITKLEFYSVFSVRVEDEMAQIPVPKPIPEEISYLAKLQSTPDFQEFKQNFETSVDSFRLGINDIVEKNAQPDLDQMLQDTLSLLHTSNGKVSVFDMLHNLRLYSDQTYVHSVNVALICNVFAGWLGMSPEDIQLATLCGLLHDIGKLVMPQEILNKPAKLTDEEFAVIMAHPTEGYRILNRYPNMDVHIQNSALMHHERCDGSGYPLRLPGNRIDRFARIVSIADVYDAMTSARIYRGPLCPFSVIEVFESEGYQKYDTKYILVFLEHVISTYLSNTVKLSNGKTGIVIYINQQYLSRPVVKCGAEFIDLSSRPDLHIVALV